jgi:hypothetical protein
MGFTVLPASPFRAPRSLGTSIPTEVSYRCRERLGRPLGALRLLKAELPPLGVVTFVAGGPTTIENTIAVGIVRLAIL